MTDVIDQSPRTTITETNNSVAITPTVQEVEIVQQNNSVEVIETTTNIIEVSTPGMQGRPGFGYNPPTDTSFTYNVDGLLETVTNDFFTKTITYDVDGNIATISDADYIQAFAYVAEQLTSITVTEL